MDYINMFGVWDKIEICLFTKGISPKYFFFERIKLKELSLGTDKVVSRARPNRDIILKIILATKV